mgnify:CR=1 FL=1
MPLLCALELGAPHARLVVILPQRIVLNNMQRVLQPLSLCKKKKKKGKKKREREREDIAYE